MTDLISHSPFARIWPRNVRMLNLRKWALIPMFLVWPYLLFAQYEGVVETPFPQQYHALDSIIDQLSEMEVAQADTKIAQLEKTAHAAEDEHTLLNFKRSMLRYRYIRTYHSKDSALIQQRISDAKQLLAEIDETEYPVIAALVHVNIGNTFHDKTSHQYHDAFTHYLRAYELFKHVQLKTYPGKHYAHYSIALAYYQFNDFETSLRLAREIETLYPVKNYISIFTVDLIGMCEMRLKNYDAARTAFEWTLQNKHYSNTPLAWQGIASGNIGVTYFEQGELNKAIPFLEEGVALTVQEGIEDNAAGFAAVLSGIYLDRGNLEAAKQNVDLAHAAAIKANSLSGLAQAYKALANYYRRIGNAALALTYSDSATAYSDSLRQRNDLNTKYQAEMAVEQERMSRQEALVQSEKTQQVLLRNAIIILLIMTIIVAFLVFGRFRQQALVNHQILIGEKDKIAGKLKVANMELNEFINGVQIRNELFEATKIEVDKLKKLAIGTESKTESIIENLEQSVILTDKDWRAFSNLFEQVHPGFFERLAEKFPDLTPSEIRFMALSRLKMGPKEIANMLGVGASAVRKMRNRLRPKLPLVENESIELFAQSI